MSKSKIIASVLIATFLLSGLGAAGCSGSKGPSPTAAGDSGRVREKLLVWADAHAWSGDAPFTVQFEASLLEEIDEPRYEWDFDDGSPLSHEINPEHTYTQVGEYRVRLRVFDKHGNKGDDFVEISAEEP